jgi:hypothetical protein
MPEMIEFTNNYQDHSTQDGYQFEFMCMRCGNGYESPFQRSVGGIGRMMAIGGGLLGGVVGDRVEEVGWMPPGCAAAIAAKAGIKLLLRRPNR